MKIRLIYINEWLLAYSKGTFITDKHDPYCISGYSLSTRTVLSSYARDNIMDVLTGDSFYINYLWNTIHNSFYIVLTPKIGSKYEYPASGLTATSQCPVERLDSLVIVYGKKQGWHIFGENTQVIKEKISKGILVSKRLFYNLRC